MQVDHIKESCPAFASGCPFSGNAAGGEVHQRCPAFDKGCPFKDKSTLSDITNLLSQLPESHQQLVGEHTEAGATVRDTLRSIHQSAVSAKQEYGSCPVFATNCIFKIKCSNMEAMISQLDLLSWGVIIAKTEVQHEASVAAISSGSALAHELKTGTAPAHRRAERVQFVREFLRSRVPLRVYQRFIASLYFVYTALEEEGRRNAQHPLYAPVHLPEDLDREEALEEDLEFYYGSDWRSAVAEVATSPAVAAYVNRIHKIGTENPELLVAHAYTRYLGDLSGGQVLKRAAIKAYGFTGGKGVAFYEFTSLMDAASQKEFKKRYREKLDSLPADHELADRIVAEANTAFDLNTNLFQELDSIMGLTDHSTPPTSASAPSGAAAAVCPFVAMKAAAAASSGGGGGGGGGGSPSTPTTTATSAGAGGAARCPFATSNTSASSTTTTSVTTVAAPKCPIPSFVFRPPFLVCMLSIGIVLYLRSRSRV